MDVKRTEVYPEPSEVCNQTRRLNCLPFTLNCNVSYAQDRVVGLLPHFILQIYTYIVFPKHRTEDGMLTALLLLHTHGNAEVIFLGFLQATCTYQELVYINKQEVNFIFKIYLSHYYRKHLTKPNNLLLISGVMDYDSVSLCFLFPILLSILQDILESTVLSQLIPEKMVSCPKD